MARKVEKIINNWNQYSLDTVAKPVDTYVVQPKPAQDSTYKDLAVALSGIHAPLAKFAKDRFDEKKAEDEAQGKKLYDENGDRQSWEDYKAANPNIPISESVKRGYLMARASNEAELIKQSLQQAYDSGQAVVKLENGREVNIALSDDPAAFDTWVRNFTRSYVENHMGPDVPPDVYANVFMPQVEDNVRQLAGRHMANRQEVMFTKAEAAFGELMQNTFHEGIANGAFDDEDLGGSAGFAARIGRQAQAALASGLPLDRVRNAVVSMFSAYAADDTLENTDELLHIAKLVEIAPGVTLGNFGKERVKIEREAEAKSRRMEAKREKEKRERKEAEQEAREAVYAKFADGVLLGKKPSKAEIYEMVKDLPGKTSQEISALVSQLQNAADLWKPPTDHYYESLARNERQMQGLFKFVAKYGQNPSPEQIAKGVAEFGMGWGNAAQFAQRYKDAKEILGGTEQTFGNMVMGNIQTYAFGGVAYNTNAQTTDKAFTIYNAVWNDYKAELKKNPDLANDPAATKQLLDDITRRRSKEVADVPVQAFSLGPDKGFSFGDSKGLGKERKTYQVFTKDVATLTDWKTQAAEFNSFIGRGGKGDEHPFMKTLKRMGVQPKDFEATTGIKLKTKADPPSMSRKRSPRPEKNS